MADKSVAPAAASKFATDEEVETSPREEQHPALVGDPEGEVVARSADGSSGTTFRKVFVIAGPDEIPSNHPQHEHNCVRTLEEALQRGLHPKGEARLVGTEVVERPRRGLVSTACTYEVEVLPAVIDTEAHETVTVSSKVQEKERTFTS
jgi:hypothetical protein